MSIPALYKSTTCIAISILITACANPPQPAKLEPVQTKIALHFAEGELPAEAIFIANKILRESFPISLTAEQGDIDYTIKRLDWLDMLDYSPWIPLLAVALIDTERGEIILRSGENDPDHLGNVLAHEIGHSLGLDHNEQKGSVMNSELVRGKRYKFTSRDIAAAALSCDVDAFSINQCPLLSP